MEIKFLLKSPSKRWFRS